MLRTMILLSVLALIGVGPTVVVAQGSPAARSAAVQTPEQIVQSIADELSDKLDGHRKDLEKNQEELIHVIDSVFLPHFDTDYASILVLGRHAREASPQQRARFAKAFYSAVTHRYAEGLLNYTRGAVEVLPFKGELNDRRTIVRTQVKLASGSSVSVDYAFRKTREGQWKAYDVIIEGISYITNYRNQVDAEIRKDGIDSLITRLETQGGKALDQKK